MKNTKTSSNLRVFVPSTGYIDRRFRNKGEAMQFLSKYYGQNWRNLGVRFETAPNFKGFDGYFADSAA